MQSTKLSMKLSTQKSNKIQSANQVNKKKN